MICHDCQRVTTTILTSSIESDPEWQTIQSEHITLTYLKRHINDSVKSLILSAQYRCRLCTLLVSQLQTLDTSNPDSTYEICIWGGRPVKCELKVALGDVDRFAEHISQWQQPRSLMFYTRERLGNQSIDGRRLSPLYALPEQDLNMFYGIRSRTAMACRLLVEA